MKLMHEHGCGNEDSRFKTPAPDTDAGQRCGRVLRHGPITVAARAQARLTASEPGMNLQNCQEHAEAPVAAFVRGLRQGASLLSRVFLNTVANREGRGLARPWLPS